MFVPTLQCIFHYIFANTLHFITVYSWSANVSRSRSNNLEPYVLFFSPGQHIRIQFASCRLKRRLRSEWRHITQCKRRLWMGFQTTELILVSIVYLPIQAHHCGSSSTGEFFCTHMREPLARRTRCCCVALRFNSARTKAVSDCQFFAP